MLRSMLIGVDTSEASESAVELALLWAQRYDARIALIGVVDEPTICAPEAVPLGGGAFKASRDAARLEDARRKVDQYLDQTTKRCAEAGAECTPLRVAGLPSQQIALEAQAHDLVLLGARANFHFETTARPDDTLHEVVKHAPRPVVAVPAVCPESDAVLIAYDGSLQAARSLGAFIASGLGHGRRIHVLGVAGDVRAAEHHIERAMRFLSLHQLQADARPLASRAAPADAVLQQIKAVDAAMVVMGAYGQSGLREFFLGSVTRKVLASSPVPVFLHH